MKQHLKKGFEQPGDSQEIHRLVRKSHKSAGPVTDDLDISALNHLERAEYLVAKGPHGAPNWVLELEMKSERIAHLETENARLRAKLKQINSLSTGWNEDD